MRVFLVLAQSRLFDLMPCSCAGTGGGQSHRCSASSGAPYGASGTQGAHRSAVLAGRAAVLSAVARCSLQRAMRPCSLRYRPTPADGCHGEAVVAGLSPLGMKTGGSVD